VNQSAFGHAARTDGKRKDFFVQEAEVKESLGERKPRRSRRLHSCVPSAETPKQRAKTARLSVVVPTRNEATNVAALVSRLEQVATRLSPRHLPMEIVFVDDSDDDTPEVVAHIASCLSLKVLHRPPAERSGGLGGAVVSGIRAASAPWVCVMDADLQHPPEVLERMLEEAHATGTDVVLASRFCEAGDVGSFSLLRRAMSRLCSGTASMLFPARLRRVSDPLSGFFLLRRDAVDLDCLRPQGFKILLEIVIRTPGLRVSEVPFHFGQRHAGETKASAREGLRYLSQLMRLRLGGIPQRLGRFGAVGATGLVVNMLLLAALADVAGLYYLAAAIVATQGSTLWNFCLTELWVFSDREHRRSRARRMGMFFLVNNAALPLRVPLLFALTSCLGMHYLLSNFLSLASLTILRFTLADHWIWVSGSRTAARDYSYDIHGIVSVCSEVHLPELERFRVDDLFGESEIRVRIGSLRTSSVSANGGSSSYGRTIRYSEGLGSLGFGVEIVEHEGRFEVLASRLLRRSPHVLYTNVVEPILRWTFVRRGYALVHGACFADGERAFMITARTDTGKTTTTLKTLDRHPYSFISDDLTIVCPDGRVLTYPKPLTISRHTVRAVRTPLLSRRERLGLIIQSRLHSRSGRRLAMLIARLRIPAATLNALVQLVVPPPKYHIERLIPSVKIAPEARLAGLVVIQRGGTGMASLDADEALEIVMSNCEDAYGFPPYAHIEGFLQGSDGSSLKEVEHDIVAGALANIPATLLRSETMDWWERLPALVHNGATAGNEADDCMPQRHEGVRRGRYVIGERQDASLQSWPSATSSRSEAYSASLVD
jgi:dolichol-phosphate mannosyltransferase